MSVGKIGNFIVVNEMLSLNPSNSNLAPPSNAPHQPPTALNKNDRNRNLVPFSYSHHGPEAVFLDIVMGDMTPKRESKRELFVSTYIKIFVSNIHISKYWKK